jgi:hypothetical protein
MKRFMVVDFSIWQLKKVQSADLLACCHVFFNGNSSHKPYFKKYILNIESPPERIAVPKLQVAFDSGRIVLTDL